jgi:nucleoside-diphosphate-sugar epimerase
MKKILLTGSSGFIGQHLINQLKDKFIIVKLKNDLRDHTAVFEEVISCNPDMVIHLAARTEVEQSFYEQTTFSEINYTGTVNLIESILKCKNTPKLIFASTMEVYGWQPESDSIRDGEIPTTIPVYSVDTPPNPNAPYAVAKYGCEKYIEYAYRTQGLQYVIIRQTNAYGRSDNDFFVTEQIISQMLSGDVCKLGYKDPYRNFLFITDLINAWDTIIDQFDNIANQTFNVGPNNAIRIEDYAKLIARKLEWKGTIIWDTKPARVGEIYLLNSSEDKLKELTGWYPKISLDEGLDKTIKIWKKIKNL